MPNNLNQNQHPVHIRYRTSPNPDNRLLHRNPKHNRCPKVVPDSFTGISTQSDVSAQNHVNTPNWYAYPKSVLHQPSVTTNVGSSPKNTAESPSKNKQNIGKQTTPLHQGIPNRLHHSIMVAYVSFTKESNHT
jgi:hypothetical protein